jgi:hypothetical protein
MLTARIMANIDRISTMGREEIAKTHVAGQSAVVSDRPGHYLRLFPDGTVIETTLGGRRLSDEHSLVRD